VWGKLKDKFVEDARYWYRHASMWVAGLAAVVLPIFGAWPELLLQILQQLPADMRAYMPLWLTPALFGLLFVTRYWKQKKPDA
jgi:hypothetical protein